jgi:hypothetical protein
MRGNVRVHQKKIIAKRRKRFLLVSLSVILSLCLIVGGLAWLSFANFMKISDVRVSGVKRLSSEYVASTTNALIEGRYGGLFSRRSALIYPHDSIEKSLFDVPAIKSVDIRTNGLRTLDIDIEERLEVARVCEGSTGDMSRCLALDEDGFAFSYSDDGAMVAYRNASSSVPVGSKVFEDAATFKSIQFFARELSALGIDPREIVIGDAGYMTVMLGGGGRLIVNFLDDLSSVLSNLSSILSGSPASLDKPTFLSRLEYMRLDAGNKVFYKLR